MSAPSLPRASRVDTKVKYFPRVNRVLVPVDLFLECSSGKVRLLITRTYLAGGQAGGQTCAALIQWERPKFSAF
jgi:hypothetical protein